MVSPTMINQNFADNLIIENDLAEGVVELRLNRPKYRNAFNSAMYLAAANRLSKNSKSKQTRIILLTGEGASFCSGMDIREASDSKQAEVVLRAARVFMNALMNCPHIVIAAVFGNVTGIGVTLLLHCDFVFAHSASLFQTPFAAVGIVPEFGSSVLFPKFLGAALTSRLLLRGECVNALTLERAGCLQVVNSNVQHTAVQYALSWSRKTPHEQWRTIEMAKALVRDPLRQQVRDIMEFEFKSIDKLLEAGVLQHLMSSRVQEIKTRRAML